MPISLDATFDKQIKRENPVENNPIVFFDLATDIYCGDRDMRFDSKTVYGLLETWSLKEGKLDFRRGTAAPNTATLTFNNEYRDILGTRQRLSDFIMGQNYLNQSVTIYWWSEGVSALALAVLPIVFKGRIEARPDYNRETLTIKLKDSIATKFDIIPLSRADIATYPYIPKENEDKPIPIIWGDWRIGLGDPSANFETEILSGLVPCFKIDTRTNQYIVADHSIDQFPSPLGIWGFDPSVKALVELQDFTIDGGSNFLFTKDSEDYKYMLFPSGTISNIIDTAGGNWTNEVFSADRDAGTFARETSGIVGDESQFDVDFVGALDPNGTIISRRVRAKRFKSTSGGVHAYNINGVPVVSDVGTDPAYSDIFGNTDAADTVVTIFKECTVSGAITLRLYELWKRIEYTAEDELLLFSAVQGREDPDGSITNSGDPIKRPNWIVEDLFRNIFSSTALNTTALDIVGSELTNFAGDFDLQIHLSEDTKTRDFLDKIGLSSKSVYFSDHEDKISGAIIEANYVSGDKTETLFWNDLSAEPVIGTIGLKDTINNLTIDYRKSAVDGKYLKTQKQSDSASQTTLNHSNVVNIKVFLQNDRNVEQLKAFMADSTSGNVTAGFWTTHRRTLTTPPMRDLRHIDWIRGDIIECDNTSFAFNNNFKLDGADWTNIFWIITEKQLVGDNLTFKMLELADIT